MIDILTEQGVAIVVKVSLIVSAVFFAQISPINEAGLIHEGLDRSFDQLFSLGLMFLFLVYMILENYNKDRKKEHLQDSLASLMQGNIMAINEFSQSNKDVSKSVERSQQANTAAIEKMTTAFEKLTDKL